MANEIFRKDEFAIEIIAHGSTTDDDPGYQGDVYTIETWVIRFNHIAVKEWCESEPIDVAGWRWHFESKDQAKKKAEANKAERAELIGKIRKALGIEADSISITHNVSEIFTVIDIRKD